MIHQCQPLMLVSQFLRILKQNFKESKWMKLILVLWYFVNIEYMLIFFFSPYQVQILIWFLFALTS